ncbi:cilia- and flagella-associated protein 157-like isoform X1 [Haplochromis burtoni]|uniref:Cilia- and flagella-associated protein 157 n=1 Tax=Haplochromis burtoni TaxID=8153 RepID=A0A3Q2V3Y4_HAPBU|nr:cilia- and flagella-associated protein 157-like isoform X1 [Haplochromis burtoni]
MPRKTERKGSDKRDGNKKTPKKENSEFPAEKSGSADKEKDLYLTQIAYLTDELERYQLKCDDLVRQRKDLLTQRSTLEQENRDTIAYLKRSLLEKEDEVGELSQRLQNQLQASDQERDALQLRHSRERQELQNRIDELIKENTALAERFASLEAFQGQKEEMMSSLESLEKQLASQKEEHKDDIHSLEMKALLEKRRLEREMESHAAAMAAEVQLLVDQKVPETTRLALQENAEVKARVGQLSEQVQILMEENAALRGCKSQLSTDVESLEEMLRETSRTSCVRKKVVEQLTEKCQQLQAEQKDCRQRLEQLQTEHAGALGKMEALRQNQASLSEQCSKNRAQVSRLEAELQQERRRRSRMKNIIQEAAVALRQALMQDSEVDQWKQLMQRMLVLLSRDGFASSAADSGKVNELQTADSAAARTRSLDPDWSFQFQLARYRPGDLGFVPRPALKHKNVLPRMEADSSRKPSSLKADSSVKLTDPAVTSKQTKLK